MAVLKRLQAVLDEAQVQYEVFNHPLAYTAQEIAAAQHVPGKELAKVVMLLVDSTLIMGVVTGNQKVELGAVKASLGAREARLATEDEFTSRFPECEIGAMPPFGNLFDLPVVVDPAVEKDEFIYFNAGNHAQTVHMKYQDFKNLVQPRIARLADKGAKKAA